MTLDDLLLQLWIGSTLEHRLLRPAIHQTVYVDGLCAAYRRDVQRDVTPDRMLAALAAEKYLIGDATPSGRVPVGAVIVGCYSGPARMALQALIYRADRAAQ